MAASVEGAGFWLPPEFLADDDFLIDTHNFAKTTANPNSHPDPDFCFPTDFPYDFPTQAVQRLEKLLATPPSPQQTAPFSGSWTGWGGGVGSGSPNGVLSPAATSPLAATQQDAVGDLIYRAAGQVTKLKLNGGAGEVVPGQKDYFAPPRSRYQLHLDAHAQNINSSVLLMSLHKQQNENGGGMWNYGPQNRGMLQAARDRAILWERSRGGAAAKRTCAGTGVFLPRRYGRDGDVKKPHSPDARKKPGCSPAPFPVTTPSPHAQAKTFDSVDVFPRPQPLAQPKRVFAPDYDNLMAQRHAALLQRQRSLISSLIEEPPMACFPHEWTY